uniref:G protein-coupled receptor n=1 Tax=Rhabditophanes sp. KR3021 TaxID=114890 RepID=A0AC35U9X6_9BILA
MKEYESSMASLTRRMNIEFNRILLVQCGSPLIVGGPLIVYIASLATAPYWTWNSGGTVIVAMLSATPIINSLAFLMFSSKNSTILRRRVIRFLNLFISSKSQIIMIKPAEPRTVGS